MPDHDTNSSRSRHRYPELDALRGIAAFVVLCRHFANSVPDQWLTFRHLLFRTPLRLVVAAHEAVLLFFLLSGFVLSVPFCQARQPYFAFLAKRTCRIYLPYLAALAIAVTAAAFFHGPLPGLSGWAQTVWPAPVSATLVLQHVLFLGRYQVDQFNPAFWSLVYEMRISLIFPLIFLAAGRFRLRWGLGAAFAISVLVWALRPGGYWEIPWSLTLHYAGIFYVGSYMAQNVDRWRPAISNLRPLSFAALTVLAVALIAVGQGTPYLIAHFDPITDWPPVVGCAWIMMAALSRPRLGSFLNFGLPQFGGRISYSLYLIHIVVLFIVLHLLSTRLPFAAMFAIVVAGSLACASLLYWLVEKPAIDLGRKAAARLNPARQRSEPVLR